MARARFLRFFIGNMASSKTRHLLTEIDTLRRYGNKRIAVFKPHTDTRSGASCPAPGTSFPTNRLAAADAYLLSELTKTGDKLEVSEEDQEEPITAACLFFESSANSSGSHETTSSSTLLPLLMTDPSVYSRKDLAVYRAANASRR